MLENLGSKKTIYTTKSGSVYTCSETYDGEFLENVSWSKSPYDARLRNAVYFYISRNYTNRLR